MRAPAGILTVGSELTLGLREDTNGPEIARALVEAGYLVAEVTAVPDDLETVAAALLRLTASCEAVVVTGGLGPTHDDLTREAASLATGLALVPDAAVRERLDQVASRHATLASAEHVYRQAFVLQGARVLAPTTGTAPGQLVVTSRGWLALLPGPPAEMRPMLEDVLAGVGGGDALPPLVLSCAGVTESDLQLRTQSVLAGFEGVGLTLLARPAEVDVVLTDDGSGPDVLRAAADAVRDALGSDCFSSDGTSLAETVLRLLAAHGLTLGAAESCTGGGLSAALTAVPGASDSFVGAIVSYSDAVKVSRLDVRPETLRAYGAVSEETAAEMARGALSALRCDVALSVTGIAGPTGGSPEKPVGTVWFGIDGPRGARTGLRRFMGDRDGVRHRAVVIGLDLVRRYLQGV